MINWTDVQSLSPEQIENLRCEVIKEIQDMKNKRFAVREELNRIEREEIVLKTRKHDFKVILAKAAHNIQERETDADLLKSKFWEKRSI